MEIVIFSLFILLTVFGHVKTGYIDCGSVKCVDDVGVVCSSNGRKCNCPPGMIGEARVVCVDPDEECACILHGDPHVIQFTSNSFDLPLPCAHRIVDLTIPLGEDDRCRVWISGRADFSNPGSLDTRSLEKIVHVKASWGPLTFTAVFQGVTPPTTELSHTEQDDGIISPSSYMYNTSGVHVSDAVDSAGYHTIVLEQCETTFKYRGSDSFFGLVTPIGVNADAGICGECTQGETTPPSQKQVLDLMLDSLWRQSPVYGNEMNSDQSCTHLTKAILDCPEGRVDFARGYCQVMLLDETIKKCIGTKAGGNEGLLARYAQCYERVCNDGGTCSEYNGFLSGCGAEVHIDSFMEKQNFCFEEEK